MEVAEFAGALPMSATRSLSGSRWALARKDGIALLVTATGALVLRALWLGDPVPTSDEQFYSLVGQQMVHGALPFVDLWDRKPVGLFGLFAVAHAIGGPSPLAYQLLAMAFAIAGGWLVYALARPMGGRKSAMAAAVLYQMLMIAYGSYGAQSEIFHVPLMLGAVLLLRDWRPSAGPWRALAAMLVCGLALQIKYTVLPQCLFLGLYALWRLHEERVPPPRIAGLAAAFALAGLGPTALAGLIYTLLGHWQAFAFANFSSFFLREASAGGRAMMAHLPAMLPLVVLLIGGIWAALRIARPRPVRHYALIAGWTLSALATALLPATVYLYYFAALVPGVVLLAVPLYDCRRMTGLAMALATVVLNYALLDMPARLHQSLERRAAVAQLAKALAPVTGPGKPCLYVHDGPSVLYSLTGACLPGRFTYPDHLNNALERPALGIDQAGEVARILRLRPAAIVTADNPVTPQAPAVLQRVRSAITGDYRLGEKRAVDGRMVSVWLRR